MFKRRNEWAAKLIAVLLMIVLGTPAYILPLKAAEVASYDHTKMEIKDGVLIHVARGESFDIPYGVTEIGPLAFTFDGIPSWSDDGWRNDDLKRVTIPNTVKKIGYNAFDSCVNLEAITIPDGVTEIEDCAFANCNKLKEVIIPDSVKIIGKNAFAH